MQALKEIYKSLQPFPNIQSTYGKDCWAIVTGSTDGLGKGFVEILAKQNVNVCLIARNEQKAQELIKEISKTSTSKFKIVIADFAKSQEKGFFEAIVKQIDQLDIGLLINNVGISHVTQLDKLQDQHVLDMIVVNCFPQTFLTRALLPILIKRKKSGILNVSSFSAIHPIPFNSVYSATKAYNDLLSRALSFEVPKNVEILSLRPLYITTPMTGNIRGNGALLPTICAQGALQRLGLDYASHGQYYHRLQGFITTYLLPNFLREHLTYKVMKKISRKYK
ncbi:hypothetical protein pb186bvf_008475 [Paramecium bursaria]